MKRQSLYILALSVLALAGCQQNELGNGQGINDGTIKYAVALEKATKGQLVNTTGDDDQALATFNEIVGEFKAKAYDATGTEKVNQTVTWSGSDWVGSPTAYWPQTAELSFLASANLPAAQTATFAATGVSLDYAVPDSATKQTDVLFGHYTGDGGNTGTAEIRFEHPLTSVLFKYGEILGNPVVKSIDMEGVAKSGTTSMTPEGVISWSGVSNYEHKVSMASKSGLAVGATSKIIGEDQAFLLIPQVLEGEDGHKVTVSVTFGTEAEDVVLTAEIATGKWQAGMTNIYTLNGDVSRYLNFTVEVTPWNVDPEEPLTMNEKDEEEPQFEWIQLWEGGPLWANMNVGATKPEEIGAYFFWGDTNGYVLNATGDGFVQATGDNIGAALSDGFSMTSYKTTAAYSNYGNSGDWLESERGTYDAAYVNIGADCHMPSKTDFEALIANTTATKTEVEGVSGWLFTGKGDFSSDSIFLPIGGSAQGNEIKSLGTLQYWSSTNKGLVSSNFYGYSLQCTGETTEVTSLGKQHGRLVRAIKDAPATEMTFVDLGLPSGTLWANMNIGAKDETDPGEFYAWGETESKSDFSNETYKWPNQEKYNATDLLTKLQAMDDVASQTLGLECAIASRELWKELFDNCSCTSESGGLRYTSENGESIFIPAAGYMAGTKVNHNYGYYWTSDVATKNNAYVALSKTVSSHSTDGVADRFRGMLVRPVKPGHKSVKIGNVLWATTNIGADTPSDYGWYFSWGNTTGYIHNGSNWVSVKDGTTLPPYSDTKGSKLDGNIPVTAEYDAARANWGGDWRMPTQEDFAALRNACTGGTGSAQSTFSELTTSNPEGGVYWLSADQELISDYKVAGVLFVDKTDKSKQVFFPAAGFLKNGSLGHEGDTGIYWSSTKSTESANVFTLLFGSNYVDPKAGYLRSPHDFYIRPVMDAPTE